jgi:phosphoglucosamine mutase
VALDCANGATYNTAPRVFKELGASVVTIGNAPDGFNINRECGSTHMQALQEVVQQEQADVGIALDGDGDRVLFVDSNGEIVDGDELLYVIAQHRYSHNNCNGVVGTQMSNLGLELALSEMNIPFERAKVGDRYVVEALKANDWVLGGESSGHILCGELNTTGDGIVSALQVMRALADANKTLAQLKSEMTKFPQMMINVKLPKRVDISQNLQINQVVAEAEKQLDGRGRVLLRPSGTEPVIRVMVEGEDSVLVNNLVNQIADVVRQQVK